MKKIKLNELKKSGELFFKLNPDAHAVYVLGGMNSYGTKQLYSPYDRATKSYICVNYENGNDRLIKASRDVFIGFEY